MSQCCGIKQHTERDVAANRPDTINKKKKEKTCTLIDVAILVDRNFVRYTRKTLDRFTTKDSYSWNITHNTESTAV
jgi:hypothetical protein